ncbi:Tetratricopeptide repeat protein 1 [Nymphaea thermarum]|nr:Tetratricopeptide repeat protein 1 [Nymphaea thermarum]
MGKSGGRRKKGVNGNAPSSAYGNGNSITTTTTTTIATPAANGNSTSTNKASAAVDGVDLDSSVFLKRAHELKEEGNRRFQSKDYAGALQQYELALKLIPKTHPDRAVFHSNRAACLLQMKPVQFDTVVAECTLALHAQPRFPRALLRRARAFEALGKFDLAVQDVQSLLQSDPNNQDALEIARRLRVALGNRQDSAQRDLQRTSSAATTTTNNHRSPSPAPPATSPLHHPLHSAISSGSYPSSTSSSLSSSSSSSYSGTSPAALGASAVPGAPLGGLGPCLPARAIPLPKKHAAKPVEKSVPEDLLASAFSASNHANNINDSVSENGVQHLSSTSSPKPSEKTKTGLPSIVLKPSKASPSSSKPVLPVSVDGESPSPAGPGAKPIKNPQGVVVSTIRWRPLKLVYDHDIRLAQMPDNCTFRVLREIVAKRFNSSKSVLIKYKDLEGDLVTITGTKELRIAESCNDILINTSKKKVMGGSGSDDGQSGGDEIGKPDSTSSTLGSKPCVLESLRLHIVEVSPEQEPPLVDEEEEEQLVEKTVLDGVAEEGIKSEETISDTSVCDAVSEGGAVDKELAKHVDAEEGIQKEKNGDGNQTDCKEVEIDDWLFEFAQLFRSHVGIDPDAHVDLHELGMELCSEALEETVTSEEAQTLFDMAASKFQEVAALAFFNWGNVHMCAARKRIPLDESSSNEVTMKQLRFAYDWVQERYSLAGQKYEEALRIKPDFYEGLLALGQQHFETAKLHWSYALASKVDLTTWDSSETIKLFNSAEEKMKAATEMWEKLEEQRNSDVKDPLTLKKEDILNRRKKSMGSQDAAGLLDGVHGGELAAALDEAAEQAAVMRSQIHLFWGNMLFERSQVEFKLDMPNWKNNLDNAVGRFKLAGASEADIEIVLKNHQSSVTSIKEDEKKTLNSAVKTS